jgi:hypothetical protein
VQKDDLGRRTLRSEERCAQHEEQHDRPSSYACRRFRSHAPDFARCRHAHMVAEADTTANAPKPRAMRAPT